MAYFLAITLKAARGHAHKGPKMQGVITKRIYVQFQEADYTPP